MDLGSGAAPTPEELATIHINMDSLHRIRPPHRDSIFNGADDDGSGTVTLLEIAQAFTHSPVKPKRSILFVWHTAEEKGLLGSAYYTDHPTVSRDSIVGQLNLDMVGRGAADEWKGAGPRYLMLVGSRRLSTELGDMVERINKTEAEPFIFDYTSGRKRPSGERLLSERPLRVCSLRYPDRVLHHRSSRGLSSGDQ